jgi:uncharacterized protein (TIGR02118 family)
VEPDEDGMFKAMILLRRSEDATVEQFRAWWLGSHASLARDLPGLRALRFNVIEEDDVGWDGIAELWFDSREAFHAAYDSDHGRRVSGDSLAHVAQRERMIVDEHTVL